MANYYQGEREYPKRDIGMGDGNRKQQDTCSSQPTAVEQHITTVQHVGFMDALVAQNPSPWTKTMFKLYFFLLVAFLNSCINGYDGSVMSGINAMTYYQSSVLISTRGTLSDANLPVVDTLMSNLQASKPVLSFRLILLEILWDRSSVDPSPIGGAEDGACSSVHQSS